MDEYLNLASIKISSIYKADLISSRWFQSTNFTLSSTITFTAWQAQ